MADEEEWRFRGAAVKSWPAVFVVAEYIHSFGNRSILIPPRLIRPDDGAVEDYGDTHDLAVLERGQKDWLRFEVKHRDLVFTCDYPYETIFVDRSEKADKTEPYAYFIVNRAKSHAAIIRGVTKPKWLGPRKVWDSKKIGHGDTGGYWVILYECPNALARFVSLKPRGISLPRETPRSQIHGQHDAAATAAQT